MAVKSLLVLLVTAAAVVQCVPPPQPTSAPTPGWGHPPPPPPPPSGTNVSLSGDLAATGSGSAVESHSENIHVQGGWGVPADLSVAAGGDAALNQDGSVIQASNLDQSSASTLNSISVAQGATADESLTVIATGLGINVDQVGASSVTGEGTSAANGLTSTTMS